MSQMATTRCGKRELRWGERTYVMGVVNVSPDSFSGDGLATAEAALAQARRLAADGADILDVGGESTRPGSAPITVEEELRRVVPAVELISAEVDAPVSVDTYKAEVARGALRAGAAMLNDIWGLKHDVEMARAAAAAGVPIVLMSNQRGGQCRDIMAEVAADLERAIQAALREGVPPENIIIDPGIGFGKTLEQNLELVRRLSELRRLGRPILLGTSRKSMIGLVLDLPPEQRIEGTAATVALGIAGGADIVRVHDVRQMSRVCRMSDAIVRGRC